jgi:SAM-dependent methyltransferase
MNPMKTYWNQEYWEHHLSRPQENDLFEELWLCRHQAFVDTLDRGSVLDLGCGIGQYTDYWMSQGFTVTSADLSSRALAEIKERNPNANVVELDMSQPLPFEDHSFDVVFASLSIHYFDDRTTLALVGELERILKPNGYLIGSVNSSRAYVYIRDYAKTIEENYYLDGDKSVRLFDRKQFETYFSRFHALLLEETETLRFGSPKAMWEFIYKKIPPPSHS